MKRKQTQYSPEIRRQIVERYLKDESVSDLAKDTGYPKSTIKGWIRIDGRAATAANSTPTVEPLNEFQKEIEVKPEDYLPESDFMADVATYIAKRFAVDRIDGLQHWADFLIMITAIIKPQLAAKSMDTPQHLIDNLSKSVADIVKHVSAKRTSLKR